MKKIWKIILSTLLVLILAAAGTIYYFLNVKTYDIADEEVEEIIDSEYEIDLPDEIEAGNSSSNNSASKSSDTVSNLSTENNESTNAEENNEKTSEPGSNSSSQGTEKNNNDSGSTASLEEANSEETVMSIKNKYRPVFHSLESQANGKIDALVGKAFNEYSTKKANGESISYSYFYQKYTSAGRDLENKTDAAFNTIYTALEKELKKNGYSTSHAKAFREQYEATKKERETALLKKASQAL